MAKEVNEDEEFSCKDLFLVGGAIVLAFILWNCYNTHRLHNTINELISKPVRVFGRPPDDSIIYSHDGQ